MPKKSGNGVHRDPPEADTKKRQGRKTEDAPRRKKRTGKSEAEAIEHFADDALEILRPHTRGRPTKYDPEFCERVMELGALGKSLTQIAVGLGVARQRLYDWQERYPDFRDAITRARELSMAWWEEQGQLGLFASSFSASAFAFQMRNRFPDHYRDTRHKEVDAGDRLAEVMKAVNGATRGLPNRN